MIWSLLALHPVHAASWHVPGRDRRVQLVYTNPTSAAPTDFPMLVRLNAQRVDYGVAQTDGWDLVFTDDTGNPIAFDIELWDPAGDSIVWVNVPMTASGTRRIWMYYGAPTPITTNPSAPDATWASTYWLGVWHLDDENESQGRYPGTYVGNDNQDVPGFLGHARYFSGNDYIEVGGNEDDFDIDQLTVSAWVRREGWREIWQPVVTKGDHAWRVHRRDNSNEITLSLDSGGDRDLDPSNADIADDTWTLVHVTYSTGGSGKGRVFVNGVRKIDQNDWGNIDNQSNRVAIGHNSDTNRFWRGWIDHVQIMSGARTEAWVQLDYASQTDALVTLRCDSEPGLAGNVHDADGDGVPCDIDCDDGNGGIGGFWFDADGDGYGGLPSDSCTPGAGVVANGTDCDDTDDTVYTGAVETCDGVDEDCDGVVDDGAPGATWYQDADGDGYGNDNDSTVACAAPTGFIATAGDCNDNNAAVFPGNPEVCDLFDNDCDGTVDDGASDAGTWWADSDGDGYGDPQTSTVACAQPVGHVANPDDCDDGSALARPGGTETCDGLDNDCNGTVDDGVPNTPSWFADVDGDGYGDPGAVVQACSQPPGYVANDQDCDDSSGEARPGGVELCDGLDNDCNGGVDDGAQDFSTYYRDFDVDGYGVTTVTVQACSPPPGYAAGSGDCNDANAAVNPGATETCNGVDDNCVGGVDEGLTELVYPDADGDGLGANVVAQAVCIGQSGYVDAPGDCDDGDASIGAERTWFRDQDGDQVGSITQSTLACFAPTGFVATTGDCNDLQALAYPGNPEVCDGVDNDCDGTVDQQTVSAPLWFPDGDDDGHGSQGVLGVRACTAPTGHVASSDDCLDSNPSVFPGAAEACNDLDDDCDGVVDDGTMDRTWFVDADGDGFGGAAGTIVDCAPPPGQVGQGGDCDDTTTQVNPNRTELCNGVDDDCDGTVDVGAADSETFWVDNDGDGFGWLNLPVIECTAPPGFVGNAEDCDDTSGLAVPGGTETCDGYDNDCNGLVDDGPDRQLVFPDTDGDGFGDSTLPATLGCLGSGYVLDNSDCNDLQADAYPPSGPDPGGAEVCDLLDNDCDGLVDDADPDVEASGTFFVDADGDGYGDPGAPVDGCTLLPGTVDNALDCDDTTADRSPDAPEVPDNGVDEDCDGTDATLALETADTAAPPDTDTDLPEPEETADTAAVDDLRRRTGCRCDQGSGLAPVWGGMLLLVAVRRRSQKV